MPSDSLFRVRRSLRKSPKYIAQRLLSEGRSQTERLFAVRRGERFDGAALLAATGDVSIDDCWNRLAARPYVAQASPVEADLYDRFCAGDRQRILSAANRALQHEVDLMGSGRICLSEKIDWHRDYKTDIRWEPEFFKDIDYNNPGQPSDVKFPWELSRVQWLIPLGQAFLLTGEEHYAESVRDVLESWIEANPYAGSVNWSCTLEAAMRIFSWTWLFHAFCRSKAWSDLGFRGRFLCSLYLHGDFTIRNIERADVNGNHYTADAAALVFAGLFFSSGRVPQRWIEDGWQILQEELPRQVFADGVDFEASIPYHRLVMECFLLPALYRKALGLDVPDSYRDRLVAMADFVAAYTRADGSAPLWGDNDNARALPFGAQDVSDHRYLLGLVASAFATGHHPLETFGPGAAEVFWVFGAKAVAEIARDTGTVRCDSTAFPYGGFYVMRNKRDHVFIDCGPLGLAGRGGHGHNDILSFEAMLDGEPLIVDCGCYIYTASYAERNNFRSTAYHNTPVIDREEANRFIRPDYLWFLHNDALPEVRQWTPGRHRDVFRGAHSGYRRLSSPITPVRTIILDHSSHMLTVIDEFEGEGEHTVEIPFHLAPGVQPSLITGSKISLRTGNKDFVLTWNEARDANAWKASIEDARVAPSYGIVLPTRKIVLRGPTKRITTTIVPAIGHNERAATQIAAGVPRTDEYSRND